MVRIWSYQRAYPAPLSNFGLGDVLDGYRVEVLCSLTRVDSAESALAQDRANPVSLLKGLLSHVGPVPNPDGIEVWACL